MESPFENINFREDGVYLLLSENEQETKKYIIEITKKYKFAVDKKDLENAISNKDLEMFLTSDKSLFMVNERMEIAISKDKLELEAIFYPPENEGASLTKDEIIQKLTENNVKYGIDESVIDEFIEYNNYTKKYTVAKGLSPTKNEDGYLDYYVNITPKKIVPKLLDNGYIDYKTLDLIVSAEAGDLLVSRVSAVKGEDGKNITGEPILCPEPKQAPNLPKGKGTEISDDGNRLTASITGQVFYQNQKISIVPILEISGSVDNSTGNIEFVGTINIAGNVLSGFSVKADGDINIKGSVEGAYIQAGGDIVISKGIQGGERAVLIAGNDIKANFIESSKLDAYNNITAGSLMHCEIKCGDTLRLIGKKGSVVGGKTVVGNAVYAMDIGSHMATDTEINVGISPRVLTKYARLVKELEKCYNEYKKYEELVQKFSNLKLDTLSNEKKILFINSIKRKLELKSRVASYKKEMILTIGLFNKKMGKIEVKNTLYSETKIVINNAVVFIKEDMKSCEVKNIANKIKIVKL